MITTMLLLFFLASAVDLTPTKLYDQGMFKLVSYPHDGATSGKTLAVTKNKGTNGIYTIERARFQFDTDTVFAANFFDRNGVWQFTEIRGNRKLGATVDRGYHVVSAYQSEGPKTQWRVVEIPVAGGLIAHAFESVAYPGYWLASNNCNHFGCVALLNAKGASQQQMRKYPQCLWNLYENYHSFACWNLLQSVNNIDSGATHTTIKWTSGYTEQLKKTAAWSHSKQTTFKAGASFAISDGIATGSIEQSMETMFKSTFSVEESHMAEATSTFSQEFSTDVLANECISFYVPQVQQMDNTWIPTPLNVGGGSKTIYTKQPCHYEPPRPLCYQSELEVEVTHVFD